MVAELVESLRKPSAESSLLELSRGEAKDIKGPDRFKKNLSLPPKSFTLYRKMTHACGIFAVRII
jgi:hypothetical protein